LEATSQGGTEEVKSGNQSLIVGLILGAVLALMLTRGPVIVPIPEPPEPEPAPSVISVLIVEETEDRLKPEMRKYLGVFNSVEIRKYLNTHCKTVDGEPNWLWVDDDADMTNAPQYWRDAMALPRKSLPWIAISNGHKGESGVLPASEDEVLALLRKWGGP
jgi:hypothetical protein